MWKNLALIGCGGTIYVMVELIYRGRSHGSMFLLGGVCFWLIGLLDEVFRTRRWGCRWRWAHGGLSAWSF